MLDRASGRELMADRDYGGGVYGLAFGPDGSLVTSSYDGFLRRYGPDLKLKAKVKAPGGTAPYGVAIDPAGRRVAVGYDGHDRRFHPRRTDAEADRPRQRTADDDTRDFRKRGLERRWPATRGGRQRWSA